MKTISGELPWAAQKEAVSLDIRQFYSYETKIAKIMGIVSPYLKTTITDEQILNLQYNLEKFFENDPTGARATMNLEQKIKKLERQLKKEQEKNSEKYPEMKILAQSKTVAEIAKYYEISYNKALYELKKRNIEARKARRR